MLLFNLHEWNDRFAQRLYAFAFQHHAQRVSQRDVGKWKHAKRHLDGGADVSYHRNGEFDAYQYQLRSHHDFDAALGPRARRRVDCKMESHPLDQYPDDGD